MDRRITFLAIGVALLSTTLLVLQVTRRGEEPVAVEPNPSLRPLKTDD